MIAAIAKRILIWAVTIVVATLLIFLVLEILPGDIAQVLLGQEARPDTVAALRESLGLNLPAHVRYFDWIGGLVVGDMGTSYTYNVPVGTLIAERLSITIPLTLASIAASIVIALVLGIYSAVHHNRIGDYAVMALSQAGIAVPGFWLGLLLIVLFSVNLGWFPASGFPGWHSGMAEASYALVLPVVALSAAQAGVLTRVIRSSVLDVLSEDFVRTAKAKGLSGLGALYRHALRNAMIPVVTIMGLQFAHGLVGAIVIENVFSLPGLGSLLFQAINQRDLIVVKNVVVVLAILIISINFLIDLLYLAIDPRLR
ncbi:MAG: ABC transporter permease [Pseudomonadota bacterium]|nr:ABC transporter permease [Pseudomonadota bacterium]